MTIPMHDEDRIDRIFKYLMLISGITTAILFIISLISLIEFPGVFKIIAILMVSDALVFLVLRTVYNFRISFKIKNKK